MSALEAQTRLPITTGDWALRPLKTSETVARDIVDDIVDQGLRTGDHLPSEAAMLEQYGVSRESLREGLRLLEVQGLITLRRGPGGGPVVGRVDPGSLGRMSTLYYHLAGATYDELFEAWVLADGILAERAARHPDRAAVRAAMEPYLTSEAYEHDDLAAFVSSHADFHSVMAGLARNRVLELNLQGIGHIVTHHFVVNLDPRQVQEMIEEDHAEIARAISAGHAVKARDAGERHILRMVEFYKGQIGDLQFDFIDWR
ncbi:MAG: hypothetical protein QOJ75_343 [Chloroflexota bacterium]|nr:hypothetical protein [Chloroflexota bacterium]